MSSKKVNAHANAIHSVEFASTIGKPPSMKATGSDLLSPLARYEHDVALREVPSAAMKMLRAQAMGRRAKRFGVDLTNGIQPMRGGGTLRTP